MSTSKLVVVTALVAAALSACVVAPYPGSYGYAPAGGPIVANIPPPAPYAEVIPAPPFAGAVWIGGYWGWQGGRHVWVGGRYEAPRPGYAWQAHHWVPHDDRWHLEGGGWVKR